MLLSYKEIGINPKLRASRNKAVAKKQSYRLDLACKALALALTNPAYIDNYELKLLNDRGVR